MIRKITKVTGITVISIILLAVTLAVSVSLLYYFYPEESVKKIIKSRAETLLERKIDIGSLHYSIKGIVIYDVTLFDKTADNTEPVLVKADEIVVTFSLFSIIKKDFKLRTIYFNGLEVNYVFDKDEKSNIERLVSELKEKSGSKDKPDSGNSGKKGDSNIQLSKIIMNNCIIKLVNPPKFIKPLEGEYRISSTIQVKKNSTFLISDTILTLPLNRGILYPELKIETSEKFILTGRVKLENASLPWVYKFSENNLQLPFDTVNGQVNDFEITSSEIKGYAKATSTLKNTKSILSAEGWCTVGIKDRSVQLKEIKGKINSSTVDVDSMFISTRKGQSGIRKFNFSNISFQLKDARPLLQSLPTALSGYVKGSLSYNGNTYSGKIDASDISYKSKTEIFSGLNTTLEINNNIIKKENIPLKLLGNNSTVSIATTDNKFKNIYLSINSEKFDINNISFRDNIDNTGQPQDDSVRKVKNDDPVSITGSINIKELLYDDFVFKNTKANVSASGNIIRINKLDTSILSGAISGIGTVDISKKSPSVQASLRYNNIKIHDIKFENEKLNNRLFGFAEGTANISLQIKEKAAETIKGNATFTITKGKVVNTGVQDGLIVFLSELRYKLKDLEFNKIYGNIDISGNNFNINSFIFNSEDIRLSMTGRIDRDLSADDMKMKLEFNNHFIKDVPRPAVAVFNKYASGKWYVIPFLLNGSITESKNMKMLEKDQ